MKSAYAVRWTRTAILALGNITAHDVDGGTGDGGQGSDGGSGQTTESSQEGKEGGAGSDAGKDADEDDDADPKVLKRKLANKTEEQDRQFKLLTAERKRADELQKKVDAEERRGKSELENAKSDLDAKDKAIAAKDDTIRRLTIENAFMTLKEIDWNNPATALRLVDLSEVEFDEETGKPKNQKQLLDAARALAKSDPYLVKSKTAVDDSLPTGKPTGKAPAGASPKPVDDQKIRDKYNIHR
jgi:hypothetical protein